MSEIKIMKDINEISKLIENKDIVEKLNLLSKQFSGKIVFSSSFQFEDQLITDLIFRNNIEIDVFTLDTGRHFEETYKTHQKTIEKYQKNIIVYFPKYEAVEELVRKKGLYSFYESKEKRIECCNIRKVELLERALKGVECWITGLRKEQSQNRQQIEEIEFDEKLRIIKFNPLINWSFEQVKEYVTKNNVPYNVLQDKGFLSVGCEPCTRAIKEGEDIRAGRWWWENNSSKECGLHKK